MPQLVKKRRSGWAVLAAGALVATMLAVVASPAAAAEQLPDAEATWKACLGPAMDGSGFADVAMGSVHHDNINCLAYYGITVGKTHGTFDPGGNVTRSQMALFLARAADKANIDLGEAADQGFMDLNADDTERVNAINLLVGAGIMFGKAETSYDPPSATKFAPGDYVQRWEMAMFLFAFLDHALVSVLIDQLPKSFDGDGTGHVELNSEDGEEGDAPDDWFGDAVRQTPGHVEDRIAALYELGVTTGTNNMVGAKGTFNPTGLVTRAQMASFIMRTLGHTNLRPAGVTAQSTSSDTQVSVRDAAFEPVVGASTEVFTTNFPDDAFDPSDRCREAYVNDQDPSFSECTIDVGDLVTDADGNALWEGVGLRKGNPLTIACTTGSYTFKSASRGGATDYTVYAFSGDMGAIVDDPSDRVESVAANTLTTRGTATKYVITGGTEAHAKMGRSVTYTVQLQDDNGNNVGPTPGENNVFTVVETIQRAGLGTTEAAQVTADNSYNGYSEFANSKPEPYHPDSSGKFTVTVTWTDSNRTSNNRDVAIAITITEPSGSNFTEDNQTKSAVVDGDNNDAGDLFTNETASVRFSDNDSTPSAITVDSPTWRLLDSRNSNSINVSVTDQYGAPYKKGDRYIKATGAPSTFDANPTLGNKTGQQTDDATNHLQPYKVGKSGSTRIGYRLAAVDAHKQDEQKQTVTLQLQSATLDNEGNPQTDDYDHDGIAATDPQKVPRYTDINITKSVDILWTKPGTKGRGDDRTILASSGGYIVVQDDPENTDSTTNDHPFAYRYGDDDRFVVHGEVVTLAQFAEILAARAAPAIKVSGGTLSWVAYDLTRPRDGATWTIEGLTCV